MASATHILKIVIRVVDQATAGMKSVDTSTKNIEKNVGRINKRMNTFDMRLLSLMFGGMALQRVMGKMARSLINTFIKAEDSTSGLGKATVRLNAAWEFMKFSIMDALNTDFFIGMIDGLIKTIEWFSQLGDSAKQSILVIIGGLFLLGGIMMVIGQTKLFTDAVFGGSGFLGGIIKSLGFAGILGIVILITAIVIVLTTKWEEMGNVANNIWEELKNPLKSIKNSLDDIAQTLGFEDSFDMIGTTGVRAFIGLGAVLINVAFAIDLIVIGLSNMAKGVKALLTGDFDTLAKLQGESFSEGVDWFDRWTEANGDYINEMEKLKTKADETYTEALGESVVPLVDNMITQLTGEDGLINGLQKQGTEMDILSGKKTDDTIISSGKRIDQNEKEIESWVKLKEAYESYLNAGDAGEIDSLIPENSPGGG